MPDIVHVTYSQSGQSSKNNAYGMREMQEKHIRQGMLSIYY